MTPLQFVVGLLAALVQASLRRLVKGRRRPSWTLMQEALTDTLRTNGRLLQTLHPRQARAFSDRLQGMGADTKGVDVARIELGGRPARRFAPAGGPAARGAILYLHGGAYVFGSSDSYRGHLARIARVTGRAVIAPDYRLAPEDPFPAALEDATACLEAALRITEGPLFVGGDSAGGGLALAATQRLDAAGPRPAGLVLLSPWVDLAAAGGSVEENAAYDWGDRRYLDNFAAQYLQDHDPKDPGASPLYGQLAGLPPVLLVFGGAELVRDQARALAERAARAGVEVTVHEDPDMVHGYWMMAPAFPAERVLERARLWLDGR